ncbi:MULTISPECIES: GNAT family N-acetyltransferase [unclassified Paludibacterium]|uniref:GNAT family N-acetyltransferase n=1 Tax=unclassified Paludibacterium TaxID=2618429 RepID=UPI001C04C512|nr:GNAT family N-acetyltransferase [Paludibacterium sp. B53371]
MLSIRPLLTTDQNRLWDWLHVALWDPPPAPLRPREVLELPGVRLYAEGWGRAGDIGVVGELPGETEPVGACWMRLVPDRQGLAYVADDVPQLGIALLPAHQHRGYGQSLMLAALQSAREQGIRQVALTVHPENPAIRLYTRCGFSQRDIRARGYWLMVADL